MKNSNDPIRQENKRALRKFIPIVIAAPVVGAILGVVLVTVG